MRWTVLVCILGFSMGEEIQDMEFRRKVASVVRDETALWQQGMVELRAENFQLRKSLSELRSYVEELASSCDQRKAEGGHPSELKIRNSRVENGVKNGVIIRKASTIASGTIFTRIDRSSIETAGISTANMSATNIFWRGIDVMKLVLRNSCQEWYESGQHISGTYQIQLKATGEVIPMYCDMDLLGGGWSLMERTLQGSSELLVAGEGASFHLNMLGSAGVPGEAKVSDRDIKALMVNGGSMLWKNLDTGTHKVFYFNEDFINEWNSTYRYNDNPRLWYEWLNEADCTWYSVNGHKNNLHFSDWNDLDIYGDAFGNETNIRSEEDLPSPPWNEYSPTLDSSGDPQYWRFHVTSSSYNLQANFNFEFYFRESALRPDFNSTTRGCNDTVALTLTSSTYEEGTWTPDTNIGFASVSFATYTKIGRLVTASFRATTNVGPGDVSQASAITGFPYAGSSGKDFRGQATVEGHSESIYGLFSGNSMTLFPWSDNVLLTRNDISSKVIFGQVTYEADS